MSEVLIIVRRYSYPLFSVPHLIIRPPRYKDGTIDGVEFTFTEGDSEYTTQAAVTCDKNAHQLTNVYIESNTTNVCVLFITLS